MVKKLITYWTCDRENMEINFESLRKGDIGLNAT
jgi:hypothetical protein